MTKLYYDIYSDEKLGNGNLGDILSHNIFETIFKNEVQRVSSVNDCECIAIGSMLEYLYCAKKNKGTVNVWGSGFIAQETKKNKNLKFPVNVDIFALRGHVSKSRLENTYNKAINVPLGDPGLLAADLIKPNEINKKYRLGIIPHYIDYNNPIFRNLSESINDSVIINILGDPLVTIKKIAECEAVVSTALHGLIVSDSLGIPNKWFEVSKNVIGDGYKFADYYSVYNIKNPKPLYFDKFYEFNSLSQFIRDSYEIDQNDVRSIKLRLIDCFPYKKNVNEVPVSLKKITKYEKYFAKLKYRLGLISSCF